MYLFLFYSYVASKIKTKERNRRESSNEIKSLIDGEMEFKVERSNNCEGMVNLMHKQKILF